MTPAPHGQSSSEYKYNMRQLLQMAQEEREREQMLSPQPTHEQVSHHASPSEPLAQMQHQPPRPPTTHGVHEAQMTQQVQPEQQSKPIEQTSQVPQGYPLHKQQSHQTAP